MKFSSRQDIDAPIDAVFEMLTDFPSIEEDVRQRGAEVSRTDTLPVHGAGMTWDATFSVAGRRQTFALSLDTFDPPTHLCVTGLSKSITGVFNVELVALPKERTRLAVDLDLKPRTISARVLFQPLRLASDSLAERFELRVADYARELEDRYNQGA